MRESRVNLSEKLFTIIGFSLLRISRYRLIFYHRLVPSPFFNFFHLFFALADELCEFIAGTVDCVLYISCRILLRGPIGIPIDFSFSSFMYRNSNIPILSESKLVRYFYKMTNHTMTCTLHYKRALRLSS